MNLPADPLEAGISEYARTLRDGSQTIVAATSAYLDRIAALNPALNAYCHIARDDALDTARALDRQLRAGVDLGILMGVPVGIKDNILVDGMPCLAGSATDAAGMIAGEGSFVAQLKKSGCVILGKLHTVEFALGNTGVNTRIGTPRNPWDAVEFRLPSGSSAGSAVAMAAGLCGFAVGTDTGGSVRGPAAHCGVFGMKYSAGRWLMDGVFPVSSTLDSLGVFTRSAKDAATVWTGLTGDAPIAPRAASQIRLGVARPYFFENLDETVASAAQQALDQLAQHPLALKTITVPGLQEVDALYNVISKSELYAYLGKKWVDANSGLMNADVYDRLSEAAVFSRDSYASSMRRRQELVRAADAIFEQVDALVSPTKREVAPVYDASRMSLDYMRLLSKHCAGPTRAANFYDFCGVTQPLNGIKGSLPVGLQAMGRSGGERGLLEIALAIEHILGEPQKPDLTLFSE